MQFIRQFSYGCSKTKQYAIHPCVALLFEVVYEFSKVRGYKIVTKFMPHDAEDLECCLELLVGQHLEDTARWCNTYVLQLWMSILLLVPFDIKTMDSSNNLSEVIVKHAMAALATTGKCRDGAAIMLAKYVTRLDIAKTGKLTEILQERLKKAYLSLCQNATSPDAAVGILQAIVEILKTGERKELLGNAKQLVPLISDELEAKGIQANTSLRKLKAKLAERIGLVLLKPKVAVWRYQRGFRSLIDNLEKKGEAGKEVKTEESKEEPEDLLFGPEIETLLDYLLNKLKDKDTVVRWSAAKGVGRITNRLSVALGDEVVSNILSLLNNQEPESSWHGACLAIAELCRRGLLLPARLDSLMCVLGNALVYDVQKGAISVGKNVRDAACYVVWTFARAYSPEIMQKYVSKLAQYLIVVSLFDRETNCRRAASAAFQEHVGRQGNFPHGIDILTEADYFTLSNRQNAYLNVARFVGQYEEYYESMIMHLVDYKLCHWENNLRELAAQALSLLVPFNPPLIVQKIVPLLCKRAVDKTLVVRHGAILGLGEVLIGLAGKSCITKTATTKYLFANLTAAEQNLLQETEMAKKFQAVYTQLQKTNNMKLLNEPLLNEIRGVIQAIEKQRLYRGKGGEIMRSGVSKLLRSMSISNIEMGPKHIKLFHSVMEENFKHPNESIQSDAKGALKEFSKAYHTGKSEEAAAFVKTLLKSVVTDENVAITRGFTMALGSLSQEILNEYVKSSSLI